MATIIADLPTSAVITAFEASSIQTVRFVDIYQADGITLWQGRVDITDGNVSVDMTRDERRNLDVTIVDPDVLYGPGNLWYDKIIKPYRGLTLPSRLEPGYLRLPGTLSNMATITRSALGSATAVEFAVRVSFNAIGVLQSLAGWFSGGAEMFIGSNNKLQIYVAKTGGGLIGAIDSSVAVPGLATNTKIWLRGKVTTATAVCQYWYSVEDTNDYDAVNWIQVGTNVTGSNAAGTTDVSKSVTVGIGAPNFATVGLAGKLYAFVEAVSNAKTIEVDPSGLADGTTSFPAITGQTVVLQTGSGIPAAIVGPQLIPGDDWVTCLGEFMVDSIERADFPSTQLQVTGRDFTKKLDLDKFSQTITFAAGSAMVENIIKTIATNGGITKFNFPAGVISAPIDFTFDRGSSRWEACKKMADSISFELYFDNFGLLTLRPFVDPLLAPLTYTFKTGATGNLARFNRSTNDSDLFNDVVVYGDGADNPLVFAQAQNTNATSPTRIAAIGRRTWLYASQFITDNTTAQSRANAFLAVMALEQYDLNLDSIVLPWLEAGDAVEVVLPDSVPTDPTRFLLSSFTIPLALSTMSGSCKRVTIVG